MNLFQLDKKKMTLRSDSFIPLVRSNDQSLFELSFKGTLPTGATLRLLGDAMRNNTNLRRLDLSCTKIQDSDMIPFLQLLVFNKGLTHLNLASNERITDITADAIVDCILERNCTLSFITLTGTSISEEKIRDITFLMTLNKFPKQLKPQAYRAMRNDDTFFTFELTYDTTDVKVYNEESIRIVAECLRHNTVVKTLKLDQCCVGEHCSSELRPLFQHNFTLRRVSLKNNYLGSDTALMIAAALEKAGDSTSLEDIDLTGNEIDDEGCNRFSELLKLNTSIRVITLLRNKCSAVALDRMRTGTALNCEPAQLKPLLPRLAANDSAVDVIDLPGTADTALRGPGRGYFTSLGASTIAEALLYNTYAHTLRLHGNHIGPEGAKAIASLLARNSTVTSIDLSMNPINDEGARHLVIAMKSNDAVVDINIDQCNVSARLQTEIAALCHLNAQPLPVKSLLKEEEPMPDSVDISYRPKQPRGKWRSLYAESMPYVLAVLAKHTNITELDLTDNLTLGDEGMLLLIPFLRTPACRLKKLIISNTSITDRTIAELTDAVSVNYIIRSIIVSPNPSTTTKPQQRLDEALQLNQYPPAVKDLAPLLMSNVDGIEDVTFTRKPDDESPPFGDDATRVILSALKNNTKVKTLRLVGHRISNRGAGYLSELLLQNRTITEVDLSVNDVGPDGISEFSDMLEQNTTLTKCNLAKNSLTEVGGTRLLKALQVANRTLVDLNVEECKILAPTKVRIDAQVASNGQSIDFRTHILEKIPGGSLSTLKFFGDVSTGFLTAASIRALLIVVQTTSGTSAASNITGIHFPFNKLADDALVPLAQLVELLPSLTEIDLSNNCFTTKAMEMALQVLGNAPQLKSFALHGEDFPVASLEAKTVEHTLKLNNESSSFRKLYFGWRSRVVAAAAAGNNSTGAAIESKRASNSSSQVIDFSAVELLNNHSSLEMFFDMLHTNLSAIPSAAVASTIVRGVQLSPNVDDDTLQAILVHIISDPVLVSSVRGLKLDGSPTKASLSEKSLTLLIEFARRCSNLIVCLVSDAVEENLKCLVDELKQQIASNRKAAADSIIDDIFEQPQRAAVEAAGRKPQSHAAGSSLAAVRSRDERAVQSQIMSEALQEMPKRVTYVRGAFGFSNARQLDEECRGFL